MMKLAWSLFAALCLPFAGCAADAQTDYEFRSAVREGKVPVKELLQRLRATVPSSEDDSSFDFRDLYHAAARKADATELNELGAMLRGLRSGSLFFDDCFGAYASRAIRLRVAELRNKRIRL